MEFMSAKEAADKWGISQRRVAYLCSEDRIDNVAMVGNMWIIPVTAKKPIDARSIRYTKNNEKKIKPFLKWAGGKGQLLSEIEKYYPFKKGKITKYAEPFVGGGAVLFDILSKYNLEAVYISDINAELINTYRIIRDDIDELVDMLTVMQKEFVPMSTDSRKKYYLEKRFRFNHLKLNGNENVNVEKAALMIFLNKTCFNGLFRVNRKGMFNVPIGSYKNPLICDRENLHAVSEKRFHGDVPDNWQGITQSAEYSEAAYNVVRTKRFPVKPMSVDEAIMQMEMLNHEFFMFVNEETNEMNVVYKRKDGDYGLLEPYR
jgi:DNA adenine methylase